MTFTDWTGLCGLALVYLLPAMRLPFASRLDARRRRLFAAGVLVAVLLPVSGGLSAAGWLRGMVGDLSLTSVLLLAGALYTRLRPVQGELWNRRERLVLLSFIAALALLLYPFALGLGALDPYRAGYGTLGAVAMLGLLAFWLMRRGLVLLPLAIAVALLGWSLGVLESDNLWDYLLDVPLALYALGALVRALFKSIFRRQSA